MRCHTFTSTTMGRVKIQLVTVRVAVTPATMNPAKIRLVMPLLPFTRPVRSFTASWPMYPMKGATILQVTNITKQRRPTVPLLFIMLAAIRRPMLCLVGLTRPRRRLHPRLSSEWRRAIAQHPAAKREMLLDRHHVRRQPGVPVPSVYLVEGSASHPPPYA
jgi:hypothetical protein